MEIKASGEENGVMVAKDRPCQPELTDLLGILQVHGVQGPRRDGEDRGHRILGEAQCCLPGLAAVSSQGCKGKKLLEHWECLLYLKCGQAQGSVLHNTARPAWGKGCSNLGASSWKVLPQGIRRALMFSTAVTARTPTEPGNLLNLYNQR